MPRRNRTTRSQRARPTTVREPALTYDQMARALVKAGKASHHILGELAPGRRTFAPPPDESNNAA